MLQQTAARNLNLRDKEAAAEACSSALALRSPHNQDGLQDCAPEKKLTELGASKHSICEGISVLTTGFGMAECAWLGFMAGMRNCVLTALINVNPWGMANCSKKTKQIPLNTGGENTQREFCKWCCSTPRSSFASRRRLWANVTMQENLAVNYNDTAIHTTDWNTVLVLGKSRPAQWQISFSHFT